MDCFLKGMPRPSALSCLRRPSEVPSHSCSGPRGRLLSSRGVLGSDCFRPALAYGVLVHKPCLFVHISVWHVMHDAKELSA